MAYEKILIIEDEKDMGNLISDCLSWNYMEPQILPEEKKLIPLLDDTPPDLVLLDINLEGFRHDGFELLGLIREHSPDLPVIILTGKNQAIDDKLHGYHLGVDDYILKPFNDKELVARIKAVLRRSMKEQIPKEESRPCCQGIFRVDYSEYRVYKGDTEIKLSTKLFRMFNVFFQNPGRIFTKEQLFNQLWENLISDKYSIDNSIMVSIHKLREALEDDPGKPRYIQTEWGFGYKFVP